MILAQRRAREGAQLVDLPGHAGRPADARDRRQGGGVPGSAAAGVQGLPAAGADERARHGARRCRSAACASSPAAPRATCSWWTCAPRRSPARTPRRRSAARTSRSTRTRSRTIREKPFVTSGIRIGSPAMTTRGFNGAKPSRLANWIADVLDAPARRGRSSSACASAVKTLCAQFPVYGP